MITIHQLRVIAITSLLFIGTVISQPCPNSCSGHGLCNTPDRVCKCFNGYEGGDCSQKKCPSGPAWADKATDTDKAHNVAVCSNMGLCDSVLGLCTCRSGYEGNACQRKSCPNSCNAAGRCLSMHQYALTKDPGEGTVYNYDTIWDANQMYGCDCDTGYYGPDCTLRKCPTGDDPLTGNSADTVANPVQVNEIQSVTCKAAGGYFTLSFRGETTQKIPYNALADDEGLSQTRTTGSLQTYIEALSTVGSLGTIITMPSLQACLETGATWTVEFVQNFGTLPLLVPNTKGLESTITSPITVERLIAGTKEDEECSRRGICDATSGICTCSTDFDTSDGYNGPGKRGDCGYATTTIQFCPGIVSCSGHGVGQCPGSPTYLCTCIAGWTGADCSERTCATGVSWFTYPSDENEAHLFEQVECSDMGTCDRSSGLCVCSIGFSGTACELMTCPGDLSPCNSFGECKDMNSLASLAQVNGESAGITYGATPNNPFTWDAFKVRGCSCDPGHTGYDCSQLLCPVGDDPVTLHQYDESQILSCIDSDQAGSVVLTFRGQSTTSIAATASTEDVKAALELLSTVGTVTVDLNDSSGQDFLCTPSGSEFLVTFLTVHGDVPDIKIASTIAIDSFTVTESVKGTKENKECSGRGLCDRATGLCTCFDGYGDSDGRGNKGILSDCGFIEQIYVNQVV